MNLSKVSKSAHVSPIQGLLNAIWPYISGKRGWILFTIVVGGIGLFLNWSWLVAVGIAPFLIAVLPCAIMCGLGACVMCNSKRNSSPPTSKNSDDMSD